MWTLWLCLDVVVFIPSVLSGQPWLLLLIHIVCLLWTFFAFFLPFPSLPFLGGVAVLYKDLGPLVSAPFCLIVEDQFCTVPWFMHLSDGA